MDVEPEPSRDGSQSRRQPRRRGIGDEPGDAGRADVGHPHRPDRRVLEARLYGPKITGRVARPLPDPAWMHTAYCPKTRSTPKPSGAVAATMGGHRAPQRAFTARARAGTRQVASLRAKNAHGRTFLGPDSSIWRRANGLSETISLDANRNRRRQAGLVGVLRPGRYRRWKPQTEYWRGTAIASDSPYSASKPSWES